MRYSDVSKRMTKDADKVKTKPFIFFLNFLLYTDDPDVFEQSTLVQHYKMKINKLYNSITNRIRMMFLLKVGLQLFNVLRSKQIVDDNFFP